MTWLEGKPLIDFAEQSKTVKQRNTVAMNMFRAWYVPFYYYGIIHGDPHLGNYTIRPDGTVNLLDFGRSEEHTSELQSLMRISYAVFCLKKKKHITNTT